MNEGNESIESAEGKLKKAVVWDLPIRVFHFTFALSISLAWIIGQTASHKSETFLYHSLFGLIAILALIVRIAYGLLAKNYSSMAGFFVSPSKVLSYFKSALTSKSQEFIGHNPGSAYVSLAMMAVLIGLIVTGLLIGQGSHTAEEIHEVMAGGMSLLVGIHVAGIILYTLKTKKNIASSMLHGKKEVPESFVASSSKPLLGIVFALVFLLWGIGLFQNLKPETKSVKLPLTSVELKLKEVKKAKKKTSSTQVEDHN